MEKSQFTETTLELNAGDAFTLYTDGLFGTAMTNKFRSTPTQLAGMINPFAASANARPTSGAKSYCAVPPYAIV